MIKQSLMISAEAKLKERIKELTCLYEVTSIIVNSDYDNLETSLFAIAKSLKKAWQFEMDAEVALKCANYEVKTKNFDSDRVLLESRVKVFNKPAGSVKVGYPKDTYRKSDFLLEEKHLLDNVSLAVGNLLERKQIRDKEAASRRLVERTDRLNILGEITAGIAHELNTPLANILGFTELLKDRTSGEASLRDLDKIIENAIFSREVVKKLMFFACEMPQQMDSIHLNPLVDEVMSLLKPNFRNNNLSFTLNFNQDPIHLKVDRIQMTQVLFNLIMNAIYTSPINGRISISVNDSGKEVKIAIADEGSGIDEAIADKVFEPFFTTKPLGKGSGLGLSVVHGIVNSHKGSISHSPNRPKGTVFTVVFPKL
jgi:signal transduction histidine kinase